MHTQFRFFRRQLVSVLTFLIIAPVFSQSNLSGKRIPLPSFQRRTLLNGMEFVFLPGQENRVPFLLLIRNGAAFDPVEKWGVTHLMMQLLLTASERRNAQQVKAELERLDMVLQGQVLWDAILVRGSLPAPHLSAGLELLAELIIEPGFDESLFAELKARLLRELEKEAEQIESVTEKALLSRVFQANPYAHDVRGEPSTVSRIELADVKIQYRKLLMPNQAYLALFAPGDPESLFSSLSRRWGRWIKKDPLPFTFQRADPPSQAQVFLLDTGGGEQTLLRWGSLGAIFGSQEDYVLRVLGHYLTLSLPAWAEEITGKAQLRGQVQVMAGRMPGYLSVSLWVPNGHLDAFLARLQGSLAELARGEVDETRLEQARRLALQDFRQALEDPSGRLQILLLTHLHQVGINYIANFALRLDRVTAERLQQTVRELKLAEAFYLVAAGPPGQIRPQLEKLGPLQVLQVLN